MEGTDLEEKVISEEDVNNRGRWNHAIKNPPEWKKALTSRNRRDKEET
jgi:hypothetical protein